MVVVEAAKTLNRLTQNANVETAQLTNQKVALGTPVTVYKRKNCAHIRMPSLTTIKGTNASQRVST